MIPGKSPAVFQYGLAAGGPLHPDTPALRSGGETRRSPLAVNYERVCTRLTGTERRAAAARLSWMAILRRFGHAGYECVPSGMFDAGARRTTREGACAPREERERRGKD